jgi:hypothetical protein
MALPISKGRSSLLSTAWIHMFVIDTRVRVIQIHLHDTDFKVYDSYSQCIDSFLISDKHRLFGGLSLQVCSVQDCFSGADMVQYTRHVSFNSSQVSDRCAIQAVLQDLRHGSEYAIAVLAQYHFCMRRDNIQVIHASISLK